MLGEYVTQPLRLRLQRLDEEVGEGRAERVGAARVLPAQAEEVREDALADLLVVVADHLVGVGQVAADADDGQLGAAWDGGAGLLAGPVLLGDRETGLALRLGVRACLVGVHRVGGGRSLIDGRTDAGAVDAGGLHAQHAVLQQPELPRRPQDATARPGTPAAPVGVHDQIVDGQGLPHAVLLDGLQAAVAGDVPLADRARRTPSELVELESRAVPAGHLLEHAVAVGQGLKGKVEVLGEAEPVAGSDGGRHVDTTDAQAEVLAHVLHDIGVGAVGFHPPAGGAQRQGDRGHRRGNLWVDLHLLEAGEVLGVAQFGDALGDLEVGPPSLPGCGGDDVALLVDGRSLSHRSAPLSAGGSPARTSRWSGCSRRPRPGRRPARRA